jgi:hypothetical protein
MKVQIEQSRLLELEDTEAKMRALEAGGVDNWEFYEVSLETYYKEKENEEKLRDLFREIEEVMMQGVYEPAGSGAGYGLQDHTSEDAFAIFRNGIRDIINGVK